MEDIIRKISAKGKPQVLYGSSEPKDGSAARKPARFASATEFVEESIRRNVLIIPGEVFSERDTHFRISYAAPDEKIRKGCEILRALAG